jgi:hypothetical protein
MTTSNTRPMPNRSLRGIKRFREDTMLTRVQRAKVEAILGEPDLKTGFIELRWGAYIGMPETPYTICHNGHIYATVYKDGHVRY